MDIYFLEHEQGTSDHTTEENYYLPPVAINTSSFQHRVEPCEPILAQDRMLRSHTYVSLCQIMNSLPPVLLVTHVLLHFLTLDRVMQQHMLYGLTVRGKLKLQLHFYLVPFCL